MNTSIFTLRSAGLAITTAATLLILVIAFMYTLTQTDAGRVCSALSGDASHYWPCQASRLITHL